jgi:cystathionine beta-lyase
MDFDFDTPIDRRGTDSIKWDRYQGRDVIPMWVADMDFASPPGVLEALRRRVDHGVFGYPTAPAELTDAVRGRLLRGYGWAVDPAWIVWLPGLVPGIHLSCRAVGDDGDEVLTQTPVYPPFLTAPAPSRRALVTVPLTVTAGRWEMDVGRIASAVTPRTRLFLLCNPHNPTGRVFTREELEPLARLCLERGLVLCSDEIHCDLILDARRRHVPSATLDPEIAARTITLLAPSKTYNIAGLGCSLAVIPDAGLRRRFEQARRGIVAGVNALGYVAALAAYRNGEPWLTALRDYLRVNRDLVAESIGRLPGLTTWVPEATYLAWVDARGLGVPDPAAFFEAHGVGLSDGREFGDPGFVRLNYGCPRERLREALERMARAVGSLAAG